VDRGAGDNKGWDGESGWCLIERRVWKLVIYDVEVLRRKWKGEGIECIARTEDMWIVNEERR
jgi:hypothetical protein